MYLDTHCHLALEQFDSDRNDVLKVLKADKDLVALVEVSVDRSSTEKMIRLFNGDDRFYFALGMHPHSAETFDQSLFEYYSELISSNKRIVAVGEIGLDVKSPVAFEKQFLVYCECVKFATSVTKPLVIHSRGYDNEIIDPLKGFENNIIFHCYSAGVDQAQRVLELGAYLSFSGIVTFPSANEVREALKYAPMDRILAETDSPYLAPQVSRGKRNTPDRVKDVIDFMADVKGVSVAVMADTIVNNSVRAFQLSI